MLTREQWIDAYIPPEDLEDLTPEESDAKQEEIETQYLAYLEENS